MNSQETYIALQTLIGKEVKRFLRVWSQTLLPPVITTSLYFLIFGSFIGSQIKPIDGFTYMQFIVPGLVMMTIITSAFQNTVSSFFFAKFQRNIEELLVSPTPYWVIIAGFVGGGILRGLLVGVIVLLVSLFFAPITIAHLGIVLVFAFLTTTLFSLAGLTNAIFAKNFDGISIFPTFVLTPLTYLGGIFYSIKALPPVWQAVSQWNPVLYMINGFRYGFLGISDVSPWLSFWVLMFFCTALTIANWHLFKTGRGLRT
jgi:ABC-2 type transport system permease protein